MMQIHDYSALWMTCAAIAVLVIGPWLLESATGRFSWFNVKNPFLIYVLLQFAIWPALVYAAGYETSFGGEVTFWTSRYGTFIEGQCYVIVGVLAFYAGYYLSLLGPRSPVESQDRGRNDAQLDGARDDRDETRMLTVLGGSVLLATCAFAMMMSSSGGFSYYIQNIDLLRTTAAAGWGVFLMPLMAANVGILLFTVHAFRSGRGRYLAYGATLLLVAFGFVIGIRHLIVAPLVGLLIAYHCLQRPIRFTLKVWLGLALFAVFNMWYAIFRGVGSEAFAILRTVDPSVFAYGLLGRFHGGESMARIIDAVRQTDFQYGLLFLRDLALDVVPRVLWPAKPVSSGIIANITFWPELYTRQDTGAAVTTLIGELYWMFGGIAVVAGMFMIGRVFRKQVRALSASEAPESAGVYALWFTFALFVNESLSLHLFQLLFKLGVWSILLWYVRRERSSPAATPILETPAAAG